MTSNDENYQNHVDELLAALATAHAQGKDIDIQFCVTGLEPNRPENQKVRDFVVKTLKRPAKEFDSAMRSQKIKEELGEVPQNASHFVKLMVDKWQISAKYNGVLRMDQVPYIEYDGKRDYITPDLWEESDFKTMISTKFKCEIGFGDLLTHVLVEADNLGLGFRDTAIRNAMEMWYPEACKERLWRVESDIAYADFLDTRKAGRDALRRLVEACFVVNDEQTVELVIDSFNKFIWQVKRKIKDMPIFDHLMVVLLGKQGNGKSTLVNALLKPVNELSIDRDFNQITDDRIISMWRSYVGFLDEMKGARRAEIDSVKHAITATHLNRRVMRTNQTQEVKQNLTFMGCANAECLADVIYDSTGTRRFVGLKTLFKMDWEVVNSTDFLSIWQSVDENAEDPMKKHKPKLQAIQEENRAVTPFESWLETLSDTTEIDIACNGIGTSKQLIASDKWTPSDLYPSYARFEKEFFPDQNRYKPLNVAHLGRQLAHCPRFKRWEIRKNHWVYSWKG
jgi:hypothetical protein